MTNRFLRLLGAGVFALSLLPLAPAVASVGVCTNFCVSTLPRADGIHIVTQRDGTVRCTSDAGCPPSTCEGTSVPSTIAQARSFCSNDLSFLSAAEIAAAGWCRDALDMTKHSTPLGRCHFGSDDVLSTTARVIVSPTPIPQPAHPGDQFRCRFICESDAAMRTASGVVRDGGTCAAASDQNTCLQECNRVCGTDMTGVPNCIGAMRGPGVSVVASGRDPDQAPQCIPTQPPGASVAGLVDTQQFEAVNESFANLSIPTFIGGVIRAMLGLAGALFFALLIWSGVQWMTAGGEQAQVKAAQTTAKNAILGVVIIALSYTLISAFIQVVSQFATPPAP